MNTVFIGSCTNGRIEDIRSVASIVKGEQVKDGVRALVVPLARQIHVNSLPLHAIHVNFTLVEILHVVVFNFLHVIGSYM